MESVVENECINSDVPSNGKEVFQEEIKTIQSNVNTQSASTPNYPLEPDLTDKLPDNSISIESETDFFNQDLNINNVPNEKIIEDVEDIVQDLENLLGESDEFEPKVNTFEKSEKLLENLALPLSKLKPPNEINSINEPSCTEVEHKEELCNEETKFCSGEEVANDSLYTEEVNEPVHSNDDESNKNQCIAAISDDKVNVCLNSAKDNCEIEKEKVVGDKSTISVPEYASQIVEATGIETIKINECIKDDDKQLSKETEEIYFEDEIQQTPGVMQDKIANEDTEILSVDNNTVETLEVINNENNTTKNVLEITSTEQNQTLININEPEIYSVTSKIDIDDCNIKQTESFIITNEDNEDNYLNENNSDLTVKNVEIDAVIEEDRNAKTSPITNITDQDGTTNENMYCGVTITAVGKSHVDEDASLKATSSHHTEETSDITFNENESSANINDLDDKIDEKNVMDMINDAATFSTTDNLSVIEIRHSPLNVIQEHTGDHENDQNTQHQSEKKLEVREINPVAVDKNLKTEIESDYLNNIDQDTAINVVTSNSSYENTCTGNSASINENIEPQSGQTLTNDATEQYNCVCSQENLNDEDKNDLLNKNEVSLEQKESSDVKKVMQFKEDSNIDVKNKEIGTEPVQLKDNDIIQNHKKDDYSLINDSEVIESKLDVNAPIDDDKREKLDQEGNTNTADMTENTSIISNVDPQKNINSLVESSSHCVSVASAEITNECWNMKDKKIKKGDNVNNNSNELENVCPLETQNELITDQQEVEMVVNENSENLILKENSNITNSNYSVNQNRDEFVDISDNQNRNEAVLIRESNETSLPEKTDVHLCKTELNSLEFVKADTEINDNNLSTENKLVIHINPTVMHESQKLEKKSISYSKEIKEIFESEDATQSAVASILSGSVQISGPSHMETPNNNCQLPSDADKSINNSNNTSPEVTVFETNETNVLENVHFSTFEAKKSDKIKIKETQELNEANSSPEILPISDTTKEFSYFKSDEILQRPLQVDVIENTDCFEKGKDQILTFTDSGECEAKNSLKITITKNKFDNMHSILKIYDPKDEHSNDELTSKQNEYTRGESIVPKITIKPIPSTEGSFSPKYEITSKPETDDSSTKHFTVETVEGQSSPKLRIKSIYTDVTTSTTDVCKKNKGNEKEILVPKKITLKSKTEDITSCSKIKYSKTGEEVTSSHSPKITIKPIKLPEETREEPIRSQSPKIIFKPLSKLQEQNSKTTETHGRQSPRITIKPVIKPDDQDCFRDVKTCPKITIKPISKPENEICDEIQSRKLSLKGNEEQTGTPRITIKPIKSDKEVESHNVIDGTSHTPRITIKPIIKPDHTSKTFNKYSEDVSKEERRHSPRLVNKLLMKNDEEFKGDFSPPTEETETRKGPKLTIKPVIKHQTLLENVDPVGDSVHQIKYVVETLQEFKEKRSSGESCNVPTVTIKPIIKPDIKETQYHSTSSSIPTEENVVIPKITIKPVVKQESHNHNEEKNTPKIIIKPLIKPPKVPVSTSTVSGSAHLEIASITNRLNIEEVGPEIKRIKQEAHDAVTAESSKIVESKHYRKNAEQVELIDFEDQIKQERIVLKINKGTISSPSKSSSDKIEKLTRLKTKLAKDCKRGCYSEHLNYEIKKQRIEMGDVTISLIDSEHSHDGSDNVCKIGIKSNENDRNHKDSVEIIPLDTLKKKIEREDDVVVVMDPLEDIPIFEITPETAAAMKQATHLLKPGISINNISSTATIPSSPAQTQAPRKRGRPRKVPLEVREDFKDPPKEEPESVQILEQNTSSRPKRSCRGQSVRNTLGIKPRKPRGGGNRGRGRGRRGGKQGIMMKMTIDTMSFEEKDEEPHLRLEQKEDTVTSIDVNINENNEPKRSSECDVFSSSIPICSTNEISSMPETFPVSPVSTIQPGPPPMLEPPKSELYEEETRMSADSSRAHTPAKQTTSTPLEVTIEESQSSIQSTATTESEKNQKSRKIPKQEVHLEPEGEIISADKLAEYCWGGGGPFMLQEQVAQFLGIKSFKRKYPGIQRRPVDMQERDFIRESGLASEAMCDMGLTAVKSEDILDIMYADFQPKYEEYCKHQRDRHAKDISNKQKALNLAASQEKNKLDIVEQAIHSTSTWNANFNKSRREQRKGCMDLQTFTIHFPKGKFRETNKPPVEHYPVALVPGQFCDYYRMYSPSQLSNLPLNTCTYKSSEDFLHEIEDSQSEVSGSDSGSSSSDSESSDSSSGVEDCKMCRRTSSQRKLLTQ